MKKTLTFHFNCHYEKIIVSYKINVAGIVLSLGISKAEHNVSNHARLLSLFSGLDDGNIVGAISCCQKNQFTIGSIEGLGTVGAGNGVLGQELTGGRFVFPDTFGIGLAAATKLATETKLLLRAGIGSGSDGNILQALVALLAR